MSSYGYPRTSQAGGAYGHNPQPTNIVHVNNDNNKSNTCINTKDCLYQWRWIIIILLSIGAFLIVVLVPLSFSYVEAGQVGLPEDRVSGNVDESGRIYTMNLEQNGRYHLGPSLTIQPFDARVQQETFDLDVVASNSRGFTLTITCFYKINQDEVGQLFTDFTQNWKTPAKNEIISTIKSIAPNYSILEYVRNISQIRSSMATALRNELVSSHLDTIDMELLLIRADFRGDIDDQFLQSVIQEQTNERQLIQREVDIISQETETQRAAIAANTTLVEATGRANATRITETARAEATKIRELAETAGFSQLFDYFGVTNSTTKVKFLEWYAISNNLNRLTLLDGVSNSIVQLT